MKMDWKKMGFASEEDYLKFLDEKLKKLMATIEGDEELLAVFKRLKDK